MLHWFTQIAGYLKPNDAYVLIYPICTKLNLQTMVTVNSFYEARIKEVSDAFWGTRDALVFDGFSP